MPDQNGTERLWPAANKDQRCGNCAHFYPVGDDGKQGQCRQAPPAVIVITKDVPQAVMSPTTMKLETKIIRHAMIQAQYPPLGPNDPGCSQFNPVKEQEA